MRLIKVIIFIWLSPFFIAAQSTLTKTLNHDNIEREYLIYIPEIYDGSQPVPVVLNYHGYTSNAQQQMFYGDFRSIADTANFIVVQPQGTVYLGSTHWNVGGWTLGSPIDDVGFTNTLIDQLISDYNIDESRIYSTGMSNGGFMSFLLACQLSDRIAAIASVTGSMTPQTYNNCYPNHPTPILQIHGVNDNVIPYDGAIFTRSIEDVIQYWVDYNGLQDEALISEFEDNDVTDNSTASLYSYSSASGKVLTEHIRIEGGGHTWPGTIINTPGTNQDFNASEYIWDFFSRYDLNTLTNSEEVISEKKISIYPNPIVDKLNIKQELISETPVTILNQMGQMVYSTTVSNKTTSLDLSTIRPGLYYLTIQNRTYKLIKS